MNLSIKEATAKVSQCSSELISASPQHATNESVLSNEQQVKIDVLMYVCQGQCVKYA